MHSTGETGLGEVTGARTTGASLRIANDDATRLRIKVFHRRLWGPNLKASTLETLCGEHLDMLHSKLQFISSTDPNLYGVDGVAGPAASIRLNPHYWAAFIYFGDWW